MAGEGRLLEAIVKRAKIRQDANRNPSRLNAQRMRNNATVEQPQTEVDVPVDRHISEMIDSNKSTPTQSELQDIRGVPDHEFEQVKERDKPGPMLHERFPDPEDRLLTILRARKIAPTSTTDPRGLANLRQGKPAATTVEEQVKQFFGDLPPEERDSLLYELLGGTSRSPE